jgi:hypothetical protein
MVWWSVYQEVSRWVHLEVREVSASAVLVVKSFSGFLFAFLWLEVDVEGIKITVVFGEPPWVLVDVSALVAVHKT